MSTVYHYAQLVTNLKPGFAITIAREELKTIRHMQLVGPFGPDWNAVDQIMEKVVGSSYTIRTHENHMTGAVTFERLRQPSADRRTYVSPDRRELFEREFDGFYRPKPNA